MPEPFPGPCLPKGGNCHIFHAFAVGSQLHTDCMLKPLIKSKRSVTVWLTRPCSSMWPPLALVDPLAPDEGCSASAWECF
ncbi:hypothetical protein VZT92_011219 [Zoarces viviparus]|uniref:Uncharacterized protein n=1 Tax=Zoarces viviparus TaxID=48416 RepID=A0AAW1FB13_ZOAVI